MNRDFSVTEFRISENMICFEQSGVRSFLFLSEKEALLVDSLNGGDLLSLVRKHTDKPVKLILTHSDGDHTGCAAQFGTVCLHPAEFARLETKLELCPELIPLQEGDVLDIGTFRFEVLLIPGHTPGSIALLEREKRFIVGGDTVQTGPVYMFGDGRSLTAYLSSLRRLKELSQDMDFFYSSHHELKVSFRTVDDLMELTEEILAGRSLTELPAPSWLPEQVKEVTDGKASLYILRKTD